MYENITLLQEVKRAMQERITNRASLLIQTAITTNTEIPISLLWRSCSHKIKEKHFFNTNSHHYYRKWYFDKMKNTYVAT